MGDTSNFCVADDTSRTSFELWDGSELPERTGQRIRQAQQRAGRELRILRLEVQAVHFGQKTSRRLQLAIDKRSIGDQLRPLVADLGTASLLDLPLHGFDARVSEDGARPPMTSVTLP